MAVIVTRAGKGSALLDVEMDANLENLDADIQTRAPAVHTHTADQVTETATVKLMTSAERTKLAGVAANATANDSDANLRNRANHTGTQAMTTITDLDVALGEKLDTLEASILYAEKTHTHTSASITDLTEAVQDIVGAFFGAGTGATVTYDDAANTITVSATGSSDPEAIRDTIGAALVGVGNITVTVNDAADTITISTTATVNATDAALRDRSTHTGTQSADTLTDGSTNRLYTSTEKTKLAGIATAATANSTDAALRDRATHTGSQAISTVTNLQSSLDAKLDDTQASAFGLSLLDDADAAAARTTLGLGTAATSAATAFAPASHTHASTAITDFTEAVQDAIGAMVAAAGGTYNDTAGTITFPASGAAPSQGTLAYAATLNTDAATNVNWAVGAMTGNATLANPTNLVAGMELKWRFLQDATGGRTLAFGSLFKFPYGITPALPPGANAKSLVTAYYDGTDLIANLTPDHR